jgi:ubiquinone/menaquinone biosynthesis C-methylase UbiE
MNETIPSNFVVPEVVISHFHLRPGDTVADFGAGSGYFLKALSTRVGPDGRVYACEIQKRLVEKVADQARQLGLLNVYPLWCDLEETQGIKISDAAVDVGLLINTLFQIQDKDVAIAEMARTVRKGGRLVLIDWTDSASGLGPVADHLVLPTEASALCESNGFVLEQEFPAGGHHYGVVFRKV